MRPALALTALLLLVSRSTADAQDGTPEVELHAGYAFLRDLGDQATNLPLGWSGSVAWNPEHSLGIVLDVGGNYKREAGNDINEHAVLAGLRYSLRGPSLTPYFEALAGTVWESVSSPGVSASAREFAIQGGAGLDLHLNERASIRVGVHFRNIFSKGESFQQLRAVAGLCLGFGSRGAHSETPTPPLPLPASSPSAETHATSSRPQPPSSPHGTPPVSASPPGMRSLPDDALGLGRDLLRSGDYARASNAFRDYLQHRATSKYTIAVGLFCDVSNAVQAAQDTVEPENLMVLVVQHSGQTCYRAYWGLYNTRQAAEQAMYSLPAALRAVGQAPVPVSRLVQ